MSLSSWQDWKNRVMRSILFTAEVGETRGGHTLFSLNTFSHAESLEESLGLAPGAEGGGTAVEAIIAHAEDDSTIARCMEVRLIRPKEGRGGGRLFFYIFLTMWSL